MIHYLEQMEVSCLFHAGYQALVVPNLCHDIPPLLDERATPAGEAPSLAASKQEQTLRLPCLHADAW